MGGALGRGLQREVNVMDAIASIPLIGGFVSTVLPFVVVLGIVVFVHEFGHYIVARWCGIRSEVFSIGFGPVLWSRRDRRGTLWQVAALPLGGYVRFLGDSDGSSRADPSALDRLSAAERAESFHGAIGRAADADGARGAGLQLPADDRRLRRASRSGRACRPSGRRSARSRRCPGVEQPLRPGDVLLAVNGAAGRRASRTSTRAAQAMPAAGPMPVRVERDGAAVDLDGALRAAAAGAGRRAAVAGERGRAAARRRDPVGRRPAARLVRRPARGGARRRAGARSRSRSGATARRSPSTSRRSSATPTTARAASSGG